MNYIFLSNNPTQDRIKYENGELVNLLAKVKIGDTVWFVGEEKERKLEAMHKAKSAKVGGKP